MVASTRDRILILLRSKGEATVAELAEALELSPGGVRRHLDGLRAEGLVDARMLRGGVGRPSFAFFLTEQAEERTPASYSRLLSRMFQRLVELKESDLRGRDGLQVLASVFEGVAREVARDHRLEVEGPTLEQRVAQASRALQAEGILDRWGREADGYHLLNSTCPYRRAAQASPAPCQADRLAIELLLGAPVEQIGRLVDGSPCCEYVVRVQAATTGEGPSR